MARRPRPRTWGTKPTRQKWQEEEGLFLKLDEAARLGRWLDAQIQATTAQPATAWHPALRNAYAVRVLLRTGLRRFELCGLTCGGFDAPAAKLWVVGKGNKQDYVPLPPAAVATFVEWLGHKRTMGEPCEADSPLFCGRAHECMSFELLRKVWKRTLEQAGLPEYKLHATRHTAGLLVYAMTHDLAKTARFLRHESVAVTERFYLHIDTEQLRQDLGGAWP